jgi:hypothetical protein
MKTISVAVSSSDYEAFREAAKKQQRSIAQLIREAMAFYREHELQERTPLRDLPVLPGHRLVGRLPSRDEIYEEMYG